MSDFQIPFLSSLVGLLADVMRVCLEFCYKMTEDLGFPSYGIAIIVLTVIIKTLLLPLALKQIRSMKAMQAIQPEMQKIQKKYKNDPQKLREEMGKLYKENGASPLSGCLPLLIQMPFLISIYYALQGFSYEKKSKGQKGIKCLIKKSARRGWGIHCPALLVSDRTGITVGFTDPANVSAIGPGSAMW